MKNVITGQPIAFCNGDLTLMKCSEFSAFFVQLCARSRMNSKICSATPGKNSIRRVNNGIAFDLGYILMDDL